MKTAKQKFLSEGEYDFIIRRITTDRADVTIEAFNLKKYLSAGLDINIWAFGFIYYSTTTTAYAISYFLPIIYRQGMGFSLGASLCLFAPPYAAAGILMYVTSWVGDRYHIRGPILIFNAMLTIIGLPLMVSVLQKYDKLTELTLSRDSPRAMEHVCWVPSLPPWAQTPMFRPLWRTR